MHAFSKGIRLIILLILSIAVSFTLFFRHSGYATDNPAAKEKTSGNLTAERLVAHACGEYKGITYTNSLNALNSNYKKGFRLFETDFRYTSDGHIVLIHDWFGTGKKLLGTGGKVYSYGNFKKRRAVKGIKLIDLDTLISWLKAHNDAFIITDCKDGNLTMLKDISAKYPDMTKRFLVQMGPFEEYDSLIQMGYTNIILALYKTNYADNDIIKFAESHSLFAVSMQQSRAETALPMRLKKLNIKVYAHTINSLIQYEHLLNNGIYGIYTDHIPPVEADNINPDYPQAS